MKLTECSMNNSSPLVGESDESNGLTKQHAVGERDDKEQEDKQHNMRQVATLFLRKTTMSLNSPFSYL